MLHPLVARRTCEECHAHLFNPDGTMIMQGRPGTTEYKPRLRNLKIAPVPCFKCPKIPHGAEPKPKNATELTPWFYRVYLHYKTCLAVGKFPDDPWVREHAMVIRLAEDEVRHSQITGPLEMIQALMTPRGK